jgi:hypothetical protein
MDLNLEVFNLITRCIRLKIDYSTTTEYLHEINSEEVADFRFLANGKKDHSQFESYTQVFDDKFGFINNLSILDLVFNEGKFALDYLKSQKLLLK